MPMLEIFTTTECKRCPKVIEYLQAKKIVPVKRVIDSDPEAETDALMLNIWAAPALRIGNAILKTKDLFTGEVLNAANIDKFLTLLKK